MKTMKNVMVASIASLAMAVSFVPVTAFAYDNTQPEEIIFFDNDTETGSDIIFFEDIDETVKTSYTMDDITIEIQKLHDQGSTYEATTVRAMQMCNGDGELEYNSVIVINQVYGVQ